MSRQLVEQRTCTFDTAKKLFYCSLCLSCACTVCSDSGRSIVIVAVAGTISQVKQHRDSGLNCMICLHSLIDWVQATQKRLVLNYLTLNDQFVILMKFFLVFWFFLLIDVDLRTFMTRLRSNCPPLCQTTTTFFSPFTTSAASRSRTHHWRPLWDTR